MPAILLQAAADQVWDLDLALVRFAFVLLCAAILTLVVVGVSWVKHNR